MKTGRNDPCHCGSGKKYKKCCLEQDSSVIINAAKSYCDHEIDEWEPEDDDWDDYDEDYDEDSEIVEDADYEDYSDNNYYFDEDDDVLDDLFDDLIGDDNEVENDEPELPEISEEETKLVDKWWDKLRAYSYKNIVAIREHLVAFMDKYPHLTDHLHLYHEALFELGGRHFRKGIYEVFVELLLRIRKEHPWTYKQSFSYYDSDLIYWYVAQGRFDEIDEFFSLFREANKMYESFYKLRVFFLSINRSDILISAFAESKNRKYILPYICNNIVLRYVDKVISDENLQALTDELEEAMKDTEASDAHEKEDIMRFLTSFQRPFTEWNTDLPKKQSQAFEYFDNITDNYAAFLFKKTDLSFDSAVNYARHVYDYFRRIISRNERPAETFMLDKKSIFEYSVKRNSNFPWGYDICCFIELNALYNFAAYLNFCGNITDDQKNEIQKTIAEFYKAVYEASKEEGPEMLSFEKFPLWEINEN